MEGVANIIQRAHASAGDVQIKATQRKAIQVQSTTETIKQNTEETIKDKNNGTKIKSESDVKDLVSQLNKALLPISTDIEFGVDKDDVFYVSIYEKETNKFISRFPAEKAEGFLPKIEEVVGMIFDTKG
jgi:flagellar protein FlaG